MFTYATTIACPDCHGPVVVVPPKTRFGGTTMNPIGWYLLVALFVFVFGLFAFSAWVAVLIALVLGLGAYFAKEKPRSMYFCPKCNRTWPYELAQVSSEQSDV